MRVGLFKISIGNVHLCSQHLSETSLILRLSQRCCTIPTVSLVTMKVLMYHGHSIALSRQHAAFSLRNCISGFPRLIIFLLGSTTMTIFTMASLLCERESIVISWVRLWMQISIAAWAFFS